MMQIHGLNELNVEKVKFQRMASVKLEMAVDNRICSFAAETLNNWVNGRLSSTNAVSYYTFLC